MELQTISDSNTPKNSKRNLSEDEISPDSLQQKKTVKMNLNPEQVQSMLESINLIPEMSRQIKDFQSIKETVSDIQKTQHVIVAAIDTIKERVQALEEEVSVLKQHPPSEVLDDIASQVSEVRKENQYLHQLSLNNVLMMRFFPIEVKTDNVMMENALRKIFATLEIEMNPNEYEAHAIKVRNKNLAHIQVKFSSSLLKTKVLKKFREVKKASTNASEPGPFLMERLMSIPSSHDLNGKFLTMQNKLTRANFDLLNAARKYAPSHFEFVYDSPEGIIMARAGGQVHQLFDENDIMELVEKIEEDKKKSKTQSQCMTSRGTAGGQKKK
jgi:hypothetical protein